MPLPTTTSRSFICTLAPLTRRPPAAGPRFATAHTLNSGIRLIGIERRVGEPIDRLLAAPVERHEHRVLTDARVEPHAEAASSRAGSSSAMSPPSSPCAPRPAGDGSPRTARARAPRSSATRRVCVARLVVREHAAGGEVEREVGRRAPPPAPWCRTAWKRARPLGVGKPSTKRRGVPGWSPVGTRPEDAVPRVDALVGDARVVGGAARAGAAQLVEDLARLAGTGSALRGPAPRPGRTRISRSVRTPAGGANARRPQHDAAFEVRHRAVLFGPLRGGQHDVGQRRGLRQEEVGHHQEIERAQPLADASRVGRRDGDVRAEHEQRAHAAGLPIVDSIS